MRTVRKRVRTVMLWAMMPLALVTARPSSGCICADGHYEPVCLAQLCPGREGAARNFAAQTACCGCSCCQASSRGGAGCCGGRSCCQRPTSGDSHSAGDGLSARDLGCCHPAPASPVVVAIRALDLDESAQQHLALPAPLVVVPEMHVAPAGVAFHDTGPPLDLVLKQHRFII